MGLTNKQQVFINEYLRDFNASQAAIRAGYSARAARVQGCRLLTNADISEEIKARISERAMTADEVLTRLAAIARGDIADLLDIHATGYNIKLLIKNEDGELVVSPKTALIRKVKQKTTTIMSQREGGEDREIVETEIELYSALEALQTLGKHHQLFNDQTDVSGEVKIVWDYPVPPPKSA